MSASHKGSKLKQTIKLEHFMSQSSAPHENLDPTCLFTFSNPLIRVEYPGYVKNIDKALESLGGIEGVQRGLERKKLPLTFHPKSEYMKGCIGDRDHNIGFLIKVRRNKSTKEVTYEVIGACDTNFKFHRMCDFQFLPLLVKDGPEHKHSEVDYLHNKVILEKLPTLDWFNKKEDTNSLFLTSAVFARFDLPQAQFKSNTYDTFNSMFRSDAPQLPDFSRRKLKEKLTVYSVRVAINQNCTIPTNPTPEALQNVKAKLLQRDLKQAKKAFEERPIWIKSALMHCANLKAESAKIVLPAVAYNCLNGPWRSCWIKFGYNPIIDPNSRIYQILDFRVRHSIGVQFKIKTKRRPFWTKVNSANLDSTHYVLKPNEIPPARQMFYQYCDIHLPEVQDMLAKLPKLASSIKYDPKNGWLTHTFMEQCREIVNKYVYEAVKNDISNDKKQTEGPGRSEGVVGYCSRMLNNIKERGIDSTVEHVNLSEDDEIDVEELMESLPERLPESLDDEGDDDSDIEIDLEAVEEVNEIVAGLKE
ncbi:general transcription factor 3C polypeptide 5 [Euwallacea fornicatus]|uniref:general transcription factor 3C polypeptide 5 n=1 Tax=Euwallacea fornicatus TaxID=995702 RepID=UPI00338F6CB8